jgi:outer membrane protein TolC
MRKSNMLLAFTFMASGYAVAQSDSLELVQCLKAARNNATLKPQLDVYNEISELKIKNANSTNLPGIGAFGKATYQSDAVSMTTPAGSMEVDLFQYNFGLEANQKIFDGGMAGKTKELERASNTADRNKVEIDLYQINNEVIRNFFSQQLFTESRNILKLKKEVLQKRAKEMESGIRNEMVKQNELDKILSEIMLIDQQILDIESKCLQSVNALGLLTGLEMSNAPTLYISDSLISFATEPRPELAYFDAEKNRIQKMAELKSKQNLPKIFAFGQAGYSYPGLNMFENQPDYYYIVGAKLSWTLYDWKQVKREKQILTKQQEIIETKKNDFNRNLSIQLENEQLEQEKLLSVIDIDKKLIVKRAAITRGSETSLNSGVITAATYLEDLNNEMKARIDLETHKIQFLNSIVKTALLKGIQL